MRDYFGIALSYAEGVVSGEIIAGLFVRAACERQLEDLTRDNFAYQFDVERAEMVCRFVERMPHTKGRWVGKTIFLEPWQIFFITTVFGWVDALGNRRFKMGYLEVARKNAKSTLAAALGLYLCFADGEPGAEVYSAATTRDQARIVWRDAKRMVDKCKGLQQKYGVETTKHAIFSERSASSFLSLSRDHGGNLDGLNVHAAVIDELHAHRTRDVFDVLETATGARQQPIILSITTAGSNQAGICFEQRNYVKRLLQKSVVDDEYFGIIYTIDEDDDWRESSCWIKANPNLNVSVSQEDIERGARKAMAIASAQNGFLTKRLNVWTSSDSAWIDPRKWDACGDDDLSIDQFSGHRCWVSIDLASKRDIACVAVLFEDGETGQYAVFVKHYLPSDAIDESSNSQYMGWVEDGHIHETPGAMTDYAAIESDLMDLAVNHEVYEVGYDPWQANYLATRLSSQGLKMVEVRQTLQNMSEPMKELEALILSGKIRHAGCPVLSWMVSNVVCHYDAKDNVYPRKQKHQDKIDGVVAIIMALGRARVPSEFSGDLCIVL